jgi:hypothetical protein
MDKETLVSASVVFGGIFATWVVCLTVIVQYIAAL